VLTIEEFIRLAADRGVKLEVIEIGGKQFLTNGLVIHPLTRGHRHLRTQARKSLCETFSLPYLDFALDERPED
jgi:hypothetical protein